MAMCLCMCVIVFIWDPVFSWLSAFSLMHEFSRLVNFWMSMPYINSCILNSEVNLIQLWFMDMFTCQGNVDHPRTSRLDNDNPCVDVAAAE